MTIRVLRSGSAVALLLVVSMLPASPETRMSSGAPLTAKADIAAYVQARDLFSAGILEPPSAAVEFSRDPDDCAGMRGRTYLVDDPPLIRVCATHPNPEVERVWRERTLVHELAHVWVYQNVDAATRTEFTNVRGLSAWSDRDYPWQDRAVEHAAEILAWGMSNGEYEVDFRIDNTGCVELARAFEILTGNAAGCTSESVDT